MITGTFPLHRSPAQRLLGYFGVVVAGAAAVAFTVVVVVAPVTGRTRVVLAAVGVVGLLVSRPGVVSSWRLVREGERTIELRPDRLVIVDGCVLTQPLEILRSEIRAVEPAPGSKYAYGAMGSARGEQAALISGIPERPTVLVRLAVPRSLPARRWADGSFGPSAIRPPKPGEVFDGVWLRTEASSPIVMWWSGADASRYDVG